jgi:hypothetical protein
MMNVLFICHPFACIVFLLSAAFRQSGRLTAPGRARLDQPMDRQPDKRADARGGDEAQREGSSRTEAWFQSIPHSARRRQRQADG